MAKHGKAKGQEATAKPETVKIHGYTVPVSAVERFGDAVGYRLADILAESPAATVSNLQAWARENGDNPDSLIKSDRACIRALMARKGKVWQGMGQGIDTMAQFASRVLFPNRFANHVNGGASAERAAKRCLSNFEEMTRAGEAILSGYREAGRTTGKGRKAKDGKDGDAALTKLSAETLTAGQAAMMVKLICESKLTVLDLHEPFTMFHAHYTALFAEYERAEREAQGTAEPIVKAA